MLVASAEPPDPMGTLHWQALSRLRHGTGAIWPSKLNPPLYYRWMYRTIEASWPMNSIKPQATSAAKSSKPGTRPSLSENSFPRLLANPGSPWWDDAATETDNPAGHRSRLPFGWLIDVGNHLGARTQPVALQTFCTRSPTDTPWPMSLFWALGSALGPLACGAAKDALCKYEFKLKKDVDYSIFSGPSMRIGIDFAHVDGAESILPTGQSGNVFSPFYDNQAPLYHTGQFRKMRMDRTDIEDHTTAVASIRPQTDR